MRGKICEQDTTMTKIGLKTPAGRIPISPAVFLMAQLVLGLVGMAVTFWGALNESTIAYVGGSVVLVLLIVASWSTSIDIQNGGDAE